MKIAGARIGRVATPLTAKRQVANGKESHNGRQGREKGQAQESETEDKQTVSRDKKEAG
jgi:hypothetical protein